MGALDKLVRDMDGANEAVDGVAGDVAKETREVEVEMESR